MALPMEDEWTSISCPRIVPHKAHMLNSHWKLPHHVGGDYFVVNISGLPEEVLWHRVTCINWPIKHVKSDTLDEEGACYRD